MPDELWETFGIHAIAVIADAWRKGLVSADFDAEEALALM